MSAPGLLVTGFPGFIAGRLLEKWLRDLPDDTPFFFLVESRFVFQAKERCQAVEKEHASFKDRWHVVEGDIRKTNLGIEESALAQIRESVGYVWHLAAVYDLAVELPIAYSVNVEGTLEVLELCETLSNLKALLYVSTCYVAGDRTGRIYEDDLDKGQNFKNHYESTKCWAEKHVRRRMDRVPTIVFRPAIVVGDSKTGETQKGDGPYFMMQLLFRLPKWVPMVSLGPSAAAVNLVPVDWLVDAMATLSRDESAVGKTFQLADPAPMSTREIMAELIKVLGRAPLLGSLPVGLVNPLTKVPRLEDLTHMPMEMLAYMNHAVDFDVSNTAAHLKGKLEPVPRLPAYFATLVDYARQNPQIF